MVLLEKLRDCRLDFPNREQLYFPDNKRMMRLVIGLLTSRGGLIKLAAGE